MSIDQARSAARVWQDEIAKHDLHVSKKIEHALFAGQARLLEAIVNDTNQPLQDALSAEFFPVIDAIAYYRRHAKRWRKSKKASTPLLLQPASSYIHYLPYGVVLIIGPYNFPFQLTMLPAIVALAAGNAVIIKPSERSQHVPKVLQALLPQFGLPEHLLTILEGDGTMATSLIDEKPDKIFFTGSERIGRKVAVKAAELGIPCDLELSGGTSMIVFADCHLERAIHAALWGSFFHAGQVCVSVERIFVEQTILYKFADQLFEQMHTLTPYAWDRLPDGDLGSLLLVADRTRIEEKLHFAKQHGAIILQAQITQDDELFYPPTLILDVEGTLIEEENEWFGPVVVVSPFQTVDDVIQRVNQRRFGLNASVFHRDHHYARRLLEALHVGNGAVNDVIVNIGNARLPFGGVKASGYGRYKGKDGFYAFLQTQAMMVKNDRKRHQINWFPYSHRRVIALQKALSWIYQKRGMQ